MATSNSTAITNVSALTALIGFAEDMGYSDAEVLAKVKHHRDQLAKPKAKSDVPSKTQRLNATLCEEVYAYLQAHGTVTAKELVEKLGSPYVTSAQKATVLLGMLTDQGRASRECAKGRAYWVKVAE
jgi:hypothetical protein